ncbi:MAG TPA: hypothetical protein VI172_05965, partial [Candidatus Dormibacteraeota bacterium]
MLRLAREFPRNEDKILRDALAELERAPEEAGKAYYSIPYTDHSTGRIVKVEGQTIRAAESLGRRWGNIRWAQRVLREDAEYADVESVAVDLETNTWVMKAARIPKLEKRRTGQVIPYDERRWSQVLGGAMSKVTRNAILAVLPAYLKSAYDKKARAIVAGVDPAALASAETVAAVKATFAKLGVTVEELEKNVERRSGLWTGDDIADLRGVWNAINTGETTVEAVFRQAPGTGPTSGGPVTVDDLSAAEVEGR